MPIVSSSVVALNGVDKTRSAAWAMAAPIDRSKSAAAGGGSGAPPKGKIVQGVIDLTFHHVAGAVLRRVLMSEGYEVEQVVLPHEAMYARQEAGDVDIMLGWLEGSHGVYLDRYRERAIVLNRVYEPYCYWGVPDFVPESEVSEIGDLARPEVAATFERRIQGITPGAGISRFSREAVQRYGLADQGFEFLTCRESPKECFDAFEEAVAEGRRVVIPHYHPQYLHSQHNIRPLRDPLNLLRGEVKDDCAPIVLKRSVASGALQQSTLALLRRVYLGNAAVSEMDYFMCVLGLSPDEAAVRWMTDNPETVESWSAGDSFTPEQRLAQMGLVLPAAALSSESAAVAPLMGLSDGSELLETAVHLPFLEDGRTLLTPARMPHQSTSCAKGQYEAKTMMKQAALNALAEIVRVLANKKAPSLAPADFEIVHLEAFLDVDPEDPLIDAEEIVGMASSLLTDVLGSTRGKHSMTAVQLRGMAGGSPVALRLRYRLMS